MTETTEATEQSAKPDYSTWTYTDHITAAEKLAAEADDMASTERTGSRAALLRENIQQTTARGWLHAKLADLKKADTTSIVTPEATTPAAKPAVAKARAQQARDGSE